MRILLPTTLLVLLACGDGGGPAGTCGVARDATAAGAATITIGAEVSSYGAFRWGENNDCPAPGSRVISVTIRGGQLEPAAQGTGLGLCLPRPDLVGAAPLALGDATRVQLAGASAAGGGCTTTVASGARPSGTVTFTGFCTKAGTAFEMVLAGQVAGTRICGAAAPEPVTLTLGGRALVLSQENP